MVWLQTTSSLRNISQAWFGDSIDQRPTSAGNLYPATLPGKQEFNNVDTYQPVPVGFRARQQSQAHFVWTWSQSLSLLHQAFALVFISSCLSFSPDYQENIFPSWSAIFIRIINWPKSFISWFVSITLWLSLLSFSQLCKMGLLNYKIHTEHLFLLLWHVQEILLPSSTGFMSTWGKRCLRQWSPAFHKDFSSS